MRGEDGVADARCRPAISTAGQKITAVVPGRDGGAPARQCSPKVGLAQRLRGPRERGLNSMTGP